MVTMLLLCALHLSLACLVTCTPLMTLSHTTEEASSSIAMSSCDADTAALVKKVEYFGEQVKRKTRYVKIPSVSIKTTRVQQRRMEGTVHRIFESLAWIRAHPKNTKFVDAIFDELPTIRRDFPEVLSRAPDEEHMFLVKVFDEITATAEEMRRIAAREECAGHMSQVIQLLVDDGDGIIVNVISLMRIMLL